jgi:hypothetical protein
MRKIQGRKSGEKADKCKDGHVATVSFSGECLAAEREGTGWMLKWRGDERRVDEGELVVLEDGTGEWWRLIAPKGTAPGPIRPMRVGQEFRDSSDAGMINWHEDDVIGGKRFLIGRCGPFLRRLVAQATIVDQERRSAAARGDYARRLDRAAKAAASLRTALGHLCQAEDLRPWGAPAKNGTEAARFLTYELNKVPNSRKQRGELWPIASLGKIAELVVARLKEWQSSWKQKRGHPPDLAVSRLETPLRAMGLSNEEIAGQRQFIGLEVDLKVAPYHRLTGAGYAREKSRDHRRPRRSGRSGPSK